MRIQVETRTVTGGGPTALGSAGTHTVIVDRRKEAGGGGLGFTGGELLYLAVAGCISNDLCREAAREGIALRDVRVTVSGEFTDDLNVSSEIEYEVALSGDVPDDELKKLARHVDEIAEIPNSLRAGTKVVLKTVKTSHDA